MKEYRIYRYFESGYVKYCASFSSLEKANKVKNEWEAQNPSAMYQIHEY